MLHLVIGPAGSGKTTKLLSAIREDVEKQVRSYLLVPEQQAYISERDFPAHLPENAGLYFEILNFSGLAERVFHDLGGGQPKKIDRSVRTLLMWNVLRTLSSSLSLYEKSTKGEGALANLMIATTEDLRANGIHPGALADCVAELDDDSPLKKKLSDLAAIYALYEERRTSLFGENGSEESLSRLSALLSEHPYFHGAHIYVDSFTSFTADEYQVLRALMKMADVTVTLTTDALPSSRPHFKGISDTGRRLKRLADEADVAWDLFTCSRPNDHTPLSHLEENLWKFGAPKYPGDASASIRTLSANTLYEECEAAALNILDLHKNGVGYGEIAVVVRDLDTYRGWLDAVLDKYKIPYFLSRRNEFATKPMARLILSALRAVCRGYRVNDLFSLVKTGLSGCDPRDAALFEEYVETWHITGNRFLDDAWSMNADGLTTLRSERGNEILATANRVRRALVEPLRQLSIHLSSAETFSGYCEALYAYLIEIKLPQTLVDLAEEELRRGEKRNAEETARMFTFFRDSLAKAVSLIGSERMTKEDFLSALSLYFSSIDMGSIPLFPDCVMLGSASTLRIENIRATLILGLYEGEFPDSYSERGLLSDKEKEELESAGLVFLSDTTLHNAEELFFVYRAMTKAREFLFLSRPKKDPDGNEQEPSIAFKRALDLFDIKSETFDKHALQIKKASQSELCTDKLDPQTGKRLKISASKVELFARCPYSYFSTYTLLSREKKDSLQGAAESGVFFHHVFERLLATYFSAGRLELPGQAALEDFLTRITNDYFEEICPLPQEELDASLLQILWQLRTIAAFLSRELLKSFKDTAFHPAFFEERVGGERLPAFEIPVGNGNAVLLTGVIDRIDVCILGGKRYLRVVDYKSHETKFSIDSLKSGEQIQLLFYLYAATHKSEYLPAGAKYLYYHTMDKTDLWGFEDSGFVLADPDIPAEETTLKKYTKAEIAELEACFEETVSSICSRIFEGDIQKTPSPDACRFCNLKKNCNQAIIEKKH